VEAVRLRWEWLLDGLDLPLAEAESRFASYGVVAGELTNKAANPILFHRLQDYSVRVSWKTELRSRLSKIFDGVVYAPVLEKIDALHKEVLRGRVFVALHMHAGDGNVHTNIPVNSDHYQMLQTAYKAVDRIMGIAKKLDGVISGEHGIGITKLEFLSEEEIGPFRAYKNKVDAILRLARRRVPDHGAIRDRQDFRLHQELPALRQVQARLLHPCAPGQPALLTAQQDSRNRLAGGSLPL